MTKGFSIKSSRVLEKLRSGGIASCMKLNMADSRAFEIAAMTGFDCLWTDMEHVANDWSVVEKQILAAKAYRTDILVRVSRGSYSDYTRPLELDASGIMVPHVMGAEDAKKVVHMTRFHPLGRRPIDGGNADGAYGNIDITEYIRDANNNRFVIAQIEDPEPLDEIDAIASLDGIDMLFFGPGDFSQGIGFPGKWDNPRIKEAQKKVADAAARAGKISGTVGNPENLADLINTGYRFICMGADVLGLARYFTGILSYFNEIEKKQPKSIYD